ncbi:hypothetical protein [Novosphingobium sp. 9U]|uniref:hypothetical protein n=1 Tax=Novosphingobium sp. 9U TaxID=2653158 RepID=UPI00135C467B|nr:hypothetical protein [Novosphingobium sp. 9U]
MGAMVHKSVWRPHAIALAAAALACLLHLVCSPALTVMTDELFHLLAARSWVHLGTFDIAEGTYQRGKVYTLLVGGLMKLTGSDSLGVARLPAMAANAALAGAFTYWAYHKAGAVAACSAAFLWIFNEWALRNSAFARFYTMQALFVWIGAMFLFRSVASRSPAVMLAATIMSLLSFLVALAFQPTTVFLITAVMIWLVLEAELSGTLRLWRDHKRWLLVLPVIVALAGYFVRPYASGFFQAPQFEADRMSAPFYYARCFLASMPLLTLAFPVAVLLAWRRDARLTRGMLVLLVVPLAIHSVAARKEERYILYLAPFFLGIWALAIGIAVQRLQRIPAILSWRRAGVTTGALTVAVLAGIMLLDRGYRGTVRLFAIEGIQAARQPARVTREIDDPPWSADLAQLRKLAAEYPTLLTAQDTEAVYRFGRYDYLINRSRIDEIFPAVEFAKDFRTGRPVLFSPDGVARVIACHEKGLIVSPDRRWRSAAWIPADTADRIERIATRIPSSVPGFHLFTWSNTGPLPPCPASPAPES